MFIEYQYYFNEEKSFPSFISDYIDEIPGGRFVIRISPDNEDKDWRKKSIKFHKYISSAKGLNLSPWYVKTVFGVEEDNYNYDDFKNSKLFSLDTTNTIGYDINAPYGRKCIYCGSGENSDDDVTIDEETVLFWKFGFTQTNKLILHIDLFEKIIKENFTGFDYKAVKCLYPEGYIIRLWCGSIEKNRKLLGKYTGEIPEDIITKESIDTTTLIVSHETFNTTEFQDFLDYLSFLDDRGELDCDLISPAKKIKNLEKCRWVEIKISGNAGIERKFNTYKSISKCLKCDIGGLVPESNLVLDYSGWDGKDFCKTKTGRICISKRAYRFISENFKVTAEPILDIK